MGYDPLRFTRPLPELILSGEKYTTWRLSHRNIAEGERVILYYNELVPFAEAVVKKVEYKTLQQLWDEGFSGHESFKSFGELLEVYSNYYGREVSFDDVAEVIHLELVYFEEDRDFLDLFKMLYQNLNNSAP